MLLLPNHEQENLVWLLEHEGRRNPGRIGVLACTAKLCVYGWRLIAARPMNRRGRLFAQQGSPL